MQGKSLDVIDEIREEMGSAFSGLDEASIKSSADKVITELYAPLKADMGKFIRSVGGDQDFTKWNVANKKLQGMIEDLDKTAFKTILNKGKATPEVIANMLRSKKKSDVAALFKKLTPEGKAKARGALIGDALLDPGGKPVSPDRFLGNIKRLGKSTGIFFTGEDKKALEGLKRALQATKRASEASVSTQSGQQLALPVGAAVATDMLGGAGAGLLTTASAGLLARAYESKPFRTLLTSLSRVKVGTPEEAVILKRIIAVTQSANRGNNNDN